MKVLLCCSLLGFIAATTAYAQHALAPPLERIELFSASNICDDLRELLTERQLVPPTVGGRVFVLRGIEEWIKDTQRNYRFSFGAEVPVLGSSKTENLTMQSLYLEAYMGASFLSFDIDNDGVNEELLVVSLQAMGTTTSERLFVKGPAFRSSENLHAPFDFKSAGLSDVVDIWLKSRTYNVYEFPPVLVYLAFEQLSDQLQGRNAAFDLAIYRYPLSYIFIEAADGKYIGVGQRSIEGEFVQVAVAKITRVAPYNSSRPFKGQPICFSSRAGTLK